MLNDREKATKIAIDSKTIGSNKLMLTTYVTQYIEVVFCKKVHLKEENDKVDIQRKTNSKNS